MEATVKQTTLSAFNALTRRWAPVALGVPSNAPIPPPSQSSTQRVQAELILASWNIDAFAPQPAARASCLLGSLLERPKVPDIIFLQEVRRDAYDFLLRDKRVRKGFFATDAADPTAFHGVPFSTVILLSRARFSFAPGNNHKGTAKQGASAEDDTRQQTILLLEQAGRTVFPSQYGRDGLFVDVRCGADGGAFRLVNVHLDSLAHTFTERSLQMATLANDLRANGRSGGLIAGDFNAISPEDDKLVDENGLRDQWIALHGEESTGHTWGIDPDVLNKFPPGRLDKVATIGLEATELDVVHPGKIAVPQPGGTSYEIPWSDHSGLICSFNI